MYAKGCMRKELEWMYRKIIKDINTGNWARVRSDLANAISGRKISKRQLENIMKHLKKTDYYSNTQSIANDKNREKPDAWNQKYLDRLSAAVVCGDTSEETVMHMFEVSNKIKWNDKGYVIGTMCKIVVAVAFIVAMATFISRRVR